MRSPCNQSGRHPIRTVSAAATGLGFGAHGLILRGLDGRVGRLGLSGDEERKQADNDKCSKHGLVSGTPGQSIAERFCSRILPNPERSGGVAGLLQRGQGCTVQEMQISGFYKATEQKSGCSNLSGPQD